MSEPASSTPAGWYPDPWKQASQRWHDGNDWTGHVDGAAEAAAVAPVAQAASPSPIQLHGDAAASPSTMQPPAIPMMQPTSSGTSGMAIAALTTGVIGIPILPLIFGIKGRREIRRSNGALSGGWMATTGIVFGILQLLVIPLILLAIAIPTFLAQKQTATATAAKANVKQIVAATESCAASNTDGSYTGCDAAKLMQLEPATSQMLSACGQPGGACLTLAPDASGYTVAVMDTGSPTSTFTQESNFDGSRSMTCSGPACPSGTW